MLSNDDCGAGRGRLRFYAQLLRYQLAFLVPLGPSFIN